MVDNREKEICRINKGHRKGINGNLGTKKEEEKHGRRVGKVERDGKFNLSFYALNT